MLKKARNSGDRAHAVESFQSGNKEKNENTKVSKASRAGVAFDHQQRLKIPTLLPFDCHHQVPRLSIEVQLAASLVKPLSTW
jgi:hypothetical protein